MININLIAGRRSKKLREMMFLRWAVLGVFLVLTSMFILNIWALYNQGTARNNNTTIANALKDRRKDAQELDEIEGTISEKKPQIRLLQQAQQSQAAWLTILADLSRIMPNDVAISNLSTSESQGLIAVRFSGIARDEKTLGDFMMDIPTKTGWAGKPKVGSVTEETVMKMRRVHFDLTVPVEGMKGGDL